MENNDTKNFKVELSFEQISILTDLAMMEKCREVGGAVASRSAAEPPSHL